ncbi:hypothetical protein JXO52_14560 [bacterium]|nr:hypothetical protein [bacterium]
MTARHLIPVLLPLCFACDLFSTRDPEPPDTAQSNWIVPLTPEQVILNLQNAVYEKNTENYIRCLPDSSWNTADFFFEPDPEVAAEYGGLFQGWSLINEEAVMRQVFSLIPGGNTCYLLFSDEEWELYGSDEAIYSASYHLELDHTQAGVDSVFEGLAVYYLSPDSRGEWSIYRWRDNGISGRTSWSRLKAAFGG